jgi:hypothetical protein
MKNASMSAFPLLPPIDPATGIGVAASYLFPENGLTKVELFAAMAMQGILSTTGDKSYDGVATNAVLFAIAVLRKLEHVTV